MNKTIWVCVLILGLLLIGGCSARQLAAMNKQMVRCDVALSGESLHGDVRCVVTGPCVDAVAPPELPLSSNDDMFVELIMFDGASTKYRVTALEPGEEALSGAYLCTSSDVGQVMLLKASSLEVLSSRPVYVEGE